MNKFSRNMTRVGKTLTTSLTLPIAGLGFLAGKTFADFEQSMAKVKAVSGATGDEFKKLEKLALDLGASTRFTASQVAELQLNYSKLGFIPDEITKITEATLDLALASGEDLATSATVAGSTLRAFGLQAEDMIMVTDVMAKSFSSSALDLMKFQVSMSSVAPVAKALGLSLQETTAMLGVMINNGIEASTAGTMLRNMMLKATADGFTMSEAFAAINSSTDKAGKALEYFDKRAVASAIVISENSTSLQKLTTTLDNSKGAAGEMADIMDNTMQGALFRMKSALEGAGIAFGEVLAPAVQSVAKGISELATWFKDLSPTMKKIITIVAGVTAAIGPLLFIIGKIPGILAAVVGGFSVLTGAFVKFTALIAANPIGALITVIGLAAAALTPYILRTREAAEAQWKLGDAIKDTSSALGQQVWATLVQGIDRSVQGMIKFTGSLANLEDNLTELSRGELESLRLYLSELIPEATRDAANETSNLIKQATLKRLAGYRAALDLVTQELKKYKKQIDLITAPGGGGEIPGLAPTTPGQAGFGDQPTVTTPERGTSLWPFQNTEAQKYKKTIVDITKEINKYRNAFDSIADNVGGIFERVKGFFSKIADFAIQAAGKFKDGWKAAAATVLSAMQQLVGMIGEILNESHQRDLDRLDEKQSRQRTQIENSLMTEEQKAKALYKLDKDSEKKRKEILREQAKDQKTVSIINAIIAGALAVVMALGSAPGPAGIIMAVIVGALAAIQIAMIASQPLPALAEGGLAFAPTMAMVGDNPNARIDPEIIAPLSKLKAFMGEGQPVEVYGILSGETILLSSKRAADTRNRTRGTYGG